MVQIFRLREDNRHYAPCPSRTTRKIRCVVSFSIPSKIYGEKPYEKSSRLSLDYTSYCQHEKRSGSEPTNCTKRIKCRDDLDPEKLKWLTWLSHEWQWYFAVNHHSENLDSTQLPHQELMQKPTTGSPAASSEEWASPPNNW